MLKLKNVSKVFNVGGNPDNEKVALFDVNLTVNPGDFITVIGGNGSGKSTLMNIISGVFPVDEGKIFIDDVDVTKMPEYKRANYLGRVFQDPMLGTASNMSIFENMSLALRRGKPRYFKWGFNKSEGELFKQKLGYLGLDLENRLESKIGLLSGGQRQSITLLMATLKEPKILLLDEHTAALDPKTASIVLDITQKVVTENNLTTLMITHNMRDAIKYGNRIIMMNNGRIILDISGEEKKQLTVDILLKKFESDKSVELNDAMILG